MIPQQADGTMPDSFRTIGLAHGMTSNASIKTQNQLDAGFFRPVTVIVNVWVPGARSVAVKTVCWGPSVGAYISTSLTKAPSSITSAIPVWGPLKPIHLTPVPVKVNVACAPAVKVSAVAPSLYALSRLSCVHFGPYAMAGSVSWWRGPEVVTSNASM